MAKLLFTGECQATVKDLKDLQVDRGWGGRPLPGELQRQGGLCPHAEAVCEGGVPKAGSCHLFRGEPDRTTGLSFKGRWGGFVRRYAGPTSSTTRPSNDRAKEMVWTEKKDLLGKSKLTNGKVSF